MCRFSTNPNGRSAYLHLTIPPSHHLTILSSLHHSIPPSLHPTKLCQVFQLKLPGSGCVYRYQLLAVGCFLPYRHYKLLHTQHNTSQAQQTATTDTKQRGKNQHSTGTAEMLHKLQALNTTDKDKTYQHNIRVSRQTSFKKAYITLAVYSSKQTLAHWSFQEGQHTPHQCTLRHGVY